MIMLLQFTVTIALTLAIYGAQKYLSTRKMWQLGAVVPLISIAALTGIYFARQIPFADLLFPSAILIALESLIWADGRHQYRREELLKMKAKDID